MTAAPKPPPERQLHSSDTVSRETLPHNERNEVVVAVERVTDAAGAGGVRKELARPPFDGTGQWAASTDRAHWNYWHREADVYRDDELRRGLEDAGLGLPAATVTETDDRVVLELEDLAEAGTPGPAFTLDDHAAFAAACGRWQARGPLDRPWASRGFLRAYSSGWDVPWYLLDDEATWRLPLVRETLPARLREGWPRLLADRARFYGLMERLPRTRSHLDVWVNNEFRRPDGTFALVDWAFCGDGAIGEDIGNHVPDATLDLLWPVGRIDELDAACFDGYPAGLREAGWRGRTGTVRLGVAASCVKYVWLLPMMLARASESSHRAYGRDVDSLEFFRARGLGLTYLLDRYEEAVELADRIGW